MNDRTGQIWRKVTTRYGTEVTLEDFIVENSVEVLSMDDDGPAQGTSHSIITWVYYTKNFEIDEMYEPSHAAWENRANLRRLL